MVSLKPLSDLILLYNHFNNISPEKSNVPENVVSSKYHDIDQIHTLTFPRKQKWLSLLHMNVCFFNKNFDDLDHLFQFINKAFEIIAICQTRIIKQTSLLLILTWKTIPVSLPVLNLHLGALSFTLLGTCLINHVLILIFIKLTNKNLHFLK